MMNTLKQSEVNDFLRKISGVLPASDITQAQRTILQEGAVFLNARVGFGGEVLGDTLSITSSFQNSVNYFRLSFSKCDFRFLKAVLDKNLPYLSKEIGPDPFIPSNFKGFLKDNVVFVPVSAGDRRFIFVFTELQDADRSLIEIFQVRASAALTSFCNQQEVCNFTETDELTGLPNLRGFKRYLEETFATERPQEYTVLLVIELDYLEMMNYYYGHPVGDFAVQVLADFLKDMEDDKSKTFHLGGEKFLLLMNVATPAAGLERARELQGRLSIFKMPAGSLTISIGLGYVGPHGGAMEELIRCADDALFETQNAGRNRIEISRLVA